MNSKDLTVDTRIQKILESPTYRVAYEDPEFMEQEELRPVRLLLELQKPRMALDQHRIHSTIVVFGSTRILSKESLEDRLQKAKQKLAKEPENSEAKKEVKIAERLFAKSKYYEEACEFARIVSKESQADHARHYVIMTGGGPGIMEAANRGAFEVGAKSIGLNITLPHEQCPNSFISPELCFQFHYFAMRKMHFLIRSKAMVAFPGGYGTMDELFETLTLVQTQKMPRFPILLFGREFWEKAINFEFLVDEGTIAPEDLKLFQYVETAKEAWSAISNFYKKNP